MGNVVELVGGANQRAAAATEADSRVNEQIRAENKALRCKVRISFRLVHRTFSNPILCCNNPLVQVVELTTENKEIESLRTKVRITFRLVYRTENFNSTVSHPNLRGNSPPRAGVRADRRQQGDQGSQD